MDTKILSNTLKESLPDAILEIQHFGSRKSQCVWIEAQFLLQVVEKLTNMDLETITAARIEESILLSYIFSPRLPRAGDTDRGSLFTIRLSMIRPCKIQSLAHYWKVASVFESEIKNTFDIEFIHSELEKRSPPKWN